MTYDPERIEELHREMRQRVGGFVTQVMVEYGFTELEAKHLVYATAWMQLEERVEHEFGRCALCGQFELAVTLADLGAGPELRIVSGCASTCPTQDR
ncbi:hypothetical protein [Gordonia tangerina]|uniref:Uncharacterized protein n=1 Tax=Gordonia tangerina TaxID=2911060 RepID=A0ABS9DIV4_9ACTN|nr:hypothetical protein [Gordonia tangerina]MCF3939077.1 hypothetical protein [Gordonia tangerina]